mmetsp:Transcript_42960/g.93539  ORF Transcript_42960/g.93539 Transcript_42960/m.93539 type:complete len:107 (+) Transcript_42960:241-561(+)
MIRATMASWVSGSTGCGQVLPVASRFGHQKLIPNSLQTLLSVSQGLGHAIAKAMEMTSAKRKGEDLGSFCFRRGQPRKEALLFGHCIAVPLLVLLQVLSPRVTFPS